MDIIRMVDTLENVAEEKRADLDRSLDLDPNLRPSGWAESDLAAIRACVELIAKVQGR